MAAFTPEQWATFDGWPAPVRRAYGLMPRLVHPDIVASWIAQGLPVRAVIARLVVACDRAAGTRQWDGREAIAQTLRECAS